VALSQGLSITTFRNVPPDLHRMGSTVADYSNDLNRDLLTRLSLGGEAYHSNAIVGANTRYAPASWISAPRFRT
jgi:hypothetical protein